MPASKAAYYGTKPRATAVANVPALTSAQITGGESPTEAEYNALQADLAATRTALNNALAALRTAGLMAP
ncbi:hypothetical protein EDD29_0064 [Actinocorallia herbida]|uniref:Uncharacterized protein n=1 Tax=Actinocorallia herbida TaxID=58109 RepID=A0A3N1CN64_9ACTN|nr:hypothetical protein [Actinocorallia herbida]ROO82584.1 hypothetical protein EDD29_0064 [Actinocorallia herbida]